MATRERTRVAFKTKKKRKSNISPKAKRKPNLVKNLKQPNRKFNEFNEITAGFLSRAGHKVLEVKKEPLYKRYVDLSNNREFNKKFLETLEYVKDQFDKNLNMKNLYKLFA